MICRTGFFSVFLLTHGTTGKHKKMAARINPRLSFKRKSARWSATASAVLPSIHPMYHNPIRIPSARKITHKKLIDKSTKILYRILPAGNLIFAGHPEIFSNATSMKYAIPQHIKFRLAPCHNPVNIHTIKRFRYRFLGFFTREPPSGIYT